MTMSLVVFSFLSLLGFLLLPRIFVHAYPSSTVGVPIRAATDATPSTGAALSGPKLDIVVSEPQCVSATEITQDQTVGTGDPFDNDALGGVSGTTATSQRLMKLVISLAILLMALLVLLVVWLHYRSMRSRKALRKLEEDKQSVGNESQEDVTALPAMRDCRNDRQTRTNHAPKAEPPPPYLPKEPARTYKPGRIHSMPWFQPRDNYVDDHTFQIELQSELARTASMATTSIKDTSRLNSISGSSQWTDCSVTEPDTVLTTSYISHEPLPANPFLTNPFLAPTKKAHRGSADLTKGFVVKQVKRLNQRGGKTHLQPITATPFLPPEILSPRETAKAIHLKTALY